MFKRLKGSIGKIDEPKPSNSLPQNRQTWSGFSTISPLNSEMEDSQFCIDDDIEETPKNSPARVTVSESTTVDLGKFSQSSISLVNDHSTFHTDIESASELDDSVSVVSEYASEITKENLYAAYKKLYGRYHKHKIKYSEIANKFKQTVTTHDKDKINMTKAQDKLLQRIAELKEQCTLEQAAKAHMEDALRNDIEERDHIISTLNTKSNFWADRFMDMEDRYSWDDRRRYQEEVEYYDWCRSMGPRNIGMGPPPLFGPPAMIGARPPPPHMMKFGPNMRPQMHNSLRRYDTVDDKHIMAKHSSLFPKQSSLKTLQKTISDTEKALKLAAEDLVKTVPEVVVPPILETQVTENAEIKKEQTKKVTTKEDGRDGSMFTFTNEKDDTKIVKKMTGSMRVGALSKGLLLVNEKEVDLVIICSVPPTVVLLNSIVSILPEKLKIVAKDETYIVNKHEADAKLTIATILEGEKYVVNVTLTSPSIREAILSAVEGESQQTEPVAIVPGEHVLDKTKCLEALAAIRHAKWFQARLAVITNGPLIIRILKDFIMREPKWHPFTPWMLELFVERVLTSAFPPNSPNATAAGLSPAESLRRFLEAIASGALLSGSTGIHLIDPCEKDPVDALAPLTVQQREDITMSAQNALRLLTFRQVNKVLGMEMLPVKQQRFTRKRRREGSTGEGNETEDVGENKKKDKKEDNQTNDLAADELSNGVVANMETEKIDTK